MSGQGRRFQAAGYRIPKPLIPVNGTPMVQRLLQCFPESWPATFVLAENHRYSGLAELLLRERAGANVLFIPPHQLGPGHAALAALPHIPDDEPVLLSYCDYGMVWDAQQFERFVLESDCDACIISYSGFHAHYLSPLTYAYSRMMGERVVEVKEKGSFTDQRENEFASAGGYYFKRSGLLREAIEYQKSIDLQLHGEFYTSLTVEALIRLQPSAQVRVFEIPFFFQWGTPEALQDFEYWERTYRSYNRWAGQPGEVEQVLMPMAGGGSRFQRADARPKPLIPVRGEPMFRSALNGLPAARGATVLVALESLRPHVEPLPMGQTAVWLESTPAGQALSTLHGIASLDPQAEVLVSSCDHQVVLDPQRWERFRRNPDCQAAILVIQGFPGAVRCPEAYTYVQPVAGEPGEFPAVERVSVKRPVSEAVRGDHLLVGTFWFAQAHLLQIGIEELCRQDLRVNGELYLDSLFACLQDLGYRCRMIPLDGYINWGDPDSLAEASYWEAAFTVPLPRGKSREASRGGFHD